MRIAFLGKGGSGKTTTAAGFVRYLAKRKPFVLALDADVNAHLRAALRISGTPVELSKNYTAVTDYLKGNRRDMDGRPFIMTTPPSPQSTFVRVTPEDQLLKNYALFDGNIALLTVGRYEQEDVGSACYHSKLSAAINILHHTADGRHDFVVSDNTAGTDTIATSLWFAFDMHVFVVEPTLKSIQVYRDFLKVVPEEMQKRVFVLANKVVDDEDIKFLRKQIPARKLLGMVRSSAHLRRFEQGDDAAMDRFFAEQEPVFDAVYRRLMCQKRDWPLYLQRLRDTHTRLCREWYDDYYGVKLDEALDDFAYEQVAPHVTRRARRSKSAAPVKNGSQR